MNQQAKLVEQMPDKILLLNLYLTQGMFLLIAAILSFIYIDDWAQFKQLFVADWQEIFLLGGGVALIVILLDLMIYKILPKKMIDDGGINERIFANRNIVHILLIASIVAICEEILFRGILQNVFGYLMANLLFAVIHVRYLSKPVLFIVTVGISFVLGYLFLITNHILVPIFAHFLIDFVLGTMIMVTKKKKQRI